MVNHSTRGANKIKPWLLVGGIVIVIGLDLAFTSLIGDEKAPSVAVYKAGKKANDLTLLPPTVDDSVEPAGSDDDTSRRRPAAHRRAALRISAVTARSRDVAKSAPPVQTEMFAPRVIVVPRHRPITLSATPATDRQASYTYAGSTYFVKATDGLDARPMSVVREKKRSFLSKALPVIKKPWQWMKALASKLR